MPTNTPISLKGRILRPPKARVHPELGARTVLTNEPWIFVSLWLKRRNSTEALFYWEQALKFYKASEGLPPESAPLLLYYCFMNAAKALLTFREVSFNPYHGVSAVKNPNPSKKVSISTERISIKGEGVLPALSQYFGETEAVRVHTVRDLFFNMPFVHRTYCLTYRSQRDMFLPIKNCTFTVELPMKRAFFQAALSQDWLSQHVVKRIPTTFESKPTLGTGMLQSKNSVACARPRRPTKANVADLGALQKGLREDIFYINGAETLWYLKARTAGPRRINRQTPTLILAAMHWLSELSRYHPLKLASLLGGRQNWLISEFIEMSCRQFIDEISAEITGHNVLVPNIRPAT